MPVLENLGGGGGAPGSGSKSPLFFGAGSLVGPGTTTRFLFPGFDDGLAQTVAVELEMGFAATLSQLRVLQEVPGSVGATMTYTLLVNGVATALAAVMLATAAGGSDLVNSVGVVAGDRVTIRITKTGTTGTPIMDVTATLLVTAA